MNFKSGQVPHNIEADPLEQRYVYLNIYFFLDTMLCVLAEQGVVLIIIQPSLGMQSLLVSSVNGKGLVPILVPM